MKKILSSIWEAAKIFLLAAIIVLPIRYFLFQPFFVLGQSMEPSFETGDYLIIDELSYRFNQPQRGEAVVLKYPADPSQRFIKRIVGLPGETIEVKDGQVFIIKDNQETVPDESVYLPLLTATAGNIKISLAENEYFVLGDNRLFSYDSRRWGPLPRKNIIGRVFFRAWPLTVFARSQAEITE